MFFALRLKIMKEVIVIWEDSVSRASFQGWHCALLVIRKSSILVCDATVVGIHDCLHPSVLDTTRKRFSCPPRSLFVRWEKNVLTHAHFRRLGTEGMIGPSSWSISRSYFHFRMSILEMHCQQINVWTWKCFTPFILLGFYHFLRVADIPLGWSSIFIGRGRYFCDRSKKFSSLQNC